MGGTFGLEALEDVFAQLDGTGMFLNGYGGRRFSMDWAGSAPLLSCPLEQAQDAEMPEHLCHGDLLAQVGEIHLGSRDGGRTRQLDRCWHGLYGGRSRGDHLLDGDSIPFVAHGFVVASLRCQGCCRCRLVPVLRGAVPQ